MEQIKFDQLNRVQLIKELETLAATAILSGFSQLAKNLASEVTVLMQGKSQLETFMYDCTVEDLDGSIELIDLYDGYRLWSKSNHFSQPDSLIDFVLFFQRSLPMYDTSGLDNEPFEGIGEIYGFVLSDTWYATIQRDRSENEDNG